VALRWIVRDVWLLENEGITIRRQPIRSDIGTDTAQVRDAVYVENSGTKAEKLSVVARFYAPNGALAGTKTQSLAIPAAGKTSVEFELSV